METTLDWIQFISIIILGLGLITAFFQTYFLRKQIKDQHEWYRREKGILYSGLFHPEIQKTKEILEEKFNIISRSDAIPEEEFKMKIAEQKDLRIHINKLLTYYENAALAVIKKVADEDILFDMIGRTLVSFRKKVINYIDYRRREAGNERLWSCFVQIANKWERRLVEKSDEYKELGT